MADSPEAIRKSVRLYLFIGLLLFIFTGITVAVASFEFLDFGKHGFDSADAVIGLLIATFKASCVAMIFMHLNHEKKSIYWIFIGSLFFAGALYGLTHLAEEDPIHDPYFYAGSAGRKAAEAAVVPAPPPGTTTGAPGATTAPPSAEPAKTQ